MARKITISFKETKKDLELFELLDSLEDKSAEIKAILRKSLTSTIPSVKQETKKDNIDIMNF